LSYKALWRQGELVENTLSVGMWKFFKAVLVFNIG